MRRARWVLVLALLGSACAENVVPRDPPPPPAAPSTSDRGEGASGARFAPDRLRVELEPFAQGFSAPLLLTHAGDDSGRLFVVEQSGSVRVLVDGRPGEIFLDISDRISAGGEQGLLGLAFHPDFADNGRLFVNYTDPSGDTVVGRFEIGSNGLADPGSEEILLRIDQPYDNHNGGHLAFGPDGYLYVATGDGGSGGDPEGNGQDKDALLGKLLRLDVDGSGYEIPDDNPFADGGGAGEVWAYGLRNPWRFSFDEPAGTLWVADVGQNALEEVNRVPADEPGLNFGWNEMEASSCYEGDCDPAGKVMPITEYGHDQGCSVTGGFVYRGRDFPALRGGYFFGDYCSGSMWAIDATAEGRVEPSLVHTSERAISSFGLDEDGEMYVTDIGSGEILRVTDGS